MKSAPRSFRSSGRLFAASVTACALVACIAEKKVASAIDATDTALAKPAAASTATTSPAATATITTDTAAKPASAATVISNGQKIGLRLVDTTETENYYAYKVEVTFAGRVDTIPGVLTFYMPVVTSDGVLHGPIFTMDEHYAGIYSYGPRTRVLSDMPLPRDASGWDSEVKLSPDASHIAYIADWGDSTGSRGIVRSWPAAAVVLTTMRAPQAPSDYSFNQVWWVSPDSVEFSWHTDVGPETKPPNPRFPFIAIFASLSGRRFTVDTLKDQPIFSTVGKH
jgi:hypothetical protein